MRGNILATEGFVTVKIEVTPADTIPNTAPYFKAKLENVKIFYSLTSSIKLPEILDDD